MSLREHCYSILVVSSSEKFVSSLSTLISSPHFSPVNTVTNISSAKRVLGERDYDFVIINSPVADDPGLRFAVDSAESEGCVVLVFVRSEMYSETVDRVVENGVFVLPKPIPGTTISIALDWMAGIREKIRGLKEKSLSFEEKMEEIRIVNRAKWILISELKMDEPQAHRYISKQAMDKCVSKREIAEEIIKVYT